MEECGYFYTAVITGGIQIVRFAVWCRRVSFSIAKGKEGGREGII